MATRSPRSPAHSPSLSPGERKLKGKLSDAFHIVQETVPSRAPSITPRSSNDPGEQEVVEPPGDDNDLPEYIVKEVIRRTIQTAAGLEKLWEEVGYSFQERVGFVDLLLQAVGRVCEERITAEKMLRSELELRITHVTEEVFEIGMKLGIPTPLDPQRRESMLYGSEANTEMTLLHRLALLEVRCDDLKKEEGKRKVQIGEIHQRIKRIRELMSEELEAEWADVSKDLSDARIAAFMAKEEAVLKEKSAREAQLVGLVLECQKLFREMKWEPELPLDYQIMSSLDPFVEEPRLRTEESSPSCVGLSKHSVDRLLGKIEELEEELNRRREQRTETYAALEILWTRLCTPESEVTAFKTLLEGFGLSYGALETMEAELQRRRADQSRALAGLVGKLREEAAGLLDEMGVSADMVVPQQAEALTCPTSSWTDATLQSCIDAVETLKARQERLAPIIKAIKKREQLVLEREEFNDQIDYSVRGVGLAEQVKRLDAAKRKIKDKLPKLNEQLRAQLLEWEAVENVPVLHEGRRYLDILEESEASWLLRSSAKQPNEKNKSEGGGSNSSTGDRSVSKDSAEITKKPKRMPPPLPARPSTSGGATPSTSLGIGSGKHERAFSSTLPEPLNLANRSGGDRGSFGGSTTPVIQHEIGNNIPGSALRNNIPPRPPVASGASSSQLGQDKRANNSNPLFNQSSDLGNPLLPSRNPMFRDR